MAPPEAVAVRPTDGQNRQKYVLPKIVEKHRIAVKRNIF
jgi:hypothetical protein